MIDSTLGLCSICQRFMDIIHVDHDHSCCPGAMTCGNCVRGLLCPRCNFGIGYFKDDLELLESAVSYLKSAKSELIHYG
jgi:hypothetical protein